MDHRIQLDEVDRIVGEIGRGPEHVIPILQAVQKRWHYLPREALERVCGMTDITPASIMGVASFYSQFRLKPAGQHLIKVCIGTACHVKGADSTFDAFRRHLGIAEDADTDADGMFTVERIACLGCCMLAPAVQIDDLTYGFVDTTRVPLVLEDFAASRRAATGPVPAVERGAEHGAVRLCLCSSCKAAGAADVFDAFRQEVQRQSLKVHVTDVGCSGNSYVAPFVEVIDGVGRSFHYGRVEPAAARRILREHFVPSHMGRRLAGGFDRLVERLAGVASDQPVTRFVLDVRDGPDARFFGRQVRIATEGAGELDPLDWDGYVGHGGFEALRRCRDELDPETVVTRITDSGLRGRGGAGFPSGPKWERVMQASGEGKTVICNADEGDPGAFMDRILLESFPYRIIEGMAIAGWAVGAREGVLFVRAEYPLAIQRVREALAQCEARGVLEDTDHGAFRIRITEGAGAFVCGEETALLAAVEGRRGTPRFRPPYPSEHGLHGAPTLINNVETLSLVPWIVRNGASEFREHGAGDSAGTKTFALAGKIVRGGLIEVPMGITLREIVEDIGGGVAGGGPWKAVQIGGPSGGCVPASMADLPVDYSALAEVGSVMGSGGMVVLDESDCMVDVARYFMVFTQHESCGKCTFCRVGTKRMLEILERLCNGEAHAGDIAALERLAPQVHQGSLCGLGRTAPNPVLSTLRFFREEYEAHVQRRCPAKHCKDLIAYRITDDCIGCTRCAQRCPADAISMTPYEKHEIDTTKCVRCDTCRQTCPVDAVVIEDRFSDDDDTD